MTLEHPIIAGPAGFHSCHWLTVSLVTWSLAASTVTAGSRGLTPLMPMLKGCDCCPSTAVSNTLTKKERAPNSQFPFY